MRGICCAFDIVSVASSSRKSKTTSGGPSTESIEKI